MEVIHYRIIRRAKGFNTSSKFVAWIQECNNPLNPEEIKKEFGVLDWEFQSCKPVYF